MSWVCCTMVLGDTQSRCPVCGRQAMNQKVCDPKVLSNPWVEKEKLYTAADLAAAEAAAYRRGMDAGRKERTVEIYTLADECWVQDLIMEQYPECFECGCHQLEETKCSSCDNSIPLPEGSSIKEAE